MINTMKTIRKAALLLLFVSVIGFASGCNETAPAEPLDYVGYETGEIDAEYDKNLFFRNEYNLESADPSVIYVSEGEWAGWFFATGTNSGSGFKIYRSQNLTDWESAGEGFVRPDDLFGTRNFWAPELMYDKDALWSDYGIVSNNAGQKGLYFLFYSAQKAVATDEYPVSYYLGVAISTQPGGPYSPFCGINANGKAVDASDPLFDIECINPETGINLDEGKSENSKLYRQRRGFIDVSPFTDPVTGDKYLYFVRNSAPVDTGNEVWGVKMKDWVTPDYTTVTRLTRHGYVTVDGDEKFNTYENSSIDEGPYTYYYDGTYYLTYSVGWTESKNYYVAQATASSPLGPFTKILPEDGGVVCKQNPVWDMQGAGHASLFTAGDELFIAYHTRPITADGNIYSRKLCVDKVYFHKNRNGITVMHTNGPTKAVQPLPEVLSGYKNVAPLAQVTATGAAEGSSALALNDGLVCFHNNETAVNDNVDEFEVTASETEITLKWDEYVTATAIMIYNSVSYEKAFGEIERIEFGYKGDDGKTGTKFINGLTFNFDANVVPLSLLYPGVNLDDLDDSFNVIRPGSSAIAIFAPMKINRITIKIKKPTRQSVLAISDIVVLGKTT